MRRCAPLLLVLLFTGLSNAQWHCGIGSGTKFLAGMVAFPDSNHGEVNSCCLQHDHDYVYAKRNPHRMSIKQADDYFWDCLNSGGRWRRYVVRPLYYAAVRVYNYFFSS